MFCALLPRILCRVGLLLPANSLLLDALLSPYARSTIRFSTPPDCTSFDVASAYGFSLPARRSENRRFEAAQTSTVCSMDVATCPSLLFPAPARTVCTLNLALCQFCVCSLGMSCAQFDTSARR
ncbi:hypothetical protein K437DRAFT_253289 [Tilletiaria anomala UBC 951]|uniref:Secreted protein n=1 Tax=Tilletiaria anomala (strain ATCC 24038 / CBS 436.72 / UBC 951) TaxID=1037660 RepID=A0A066WQH7_TILAU|nr:uncharacterized protein K437DRAFT_253289 [Tilletiaria anomala UBC 951]KDN53269.1 hypothetical protein K437DRAFT_253289 [Tilletiaria anomala UBC 951]